MIDHVSRSIAGVCRYVMHVLILAAGITLIVLPLYVMVHLVRKYW